MSKGASKYARSGGKFTGNHTTLTQLACQVADIANKLSGVKKITPGFIQSGIGSGKCARRVKFTDESNACILLSIRENGTHQEVRVYVSDLQETRTALARAVRDEDIPIRFTKD